MPIKREIKEINIIEISNIDELRLDKKVAFYLEMDDINYHKGHILGLSIADCNNTYFIPKDLVKDSIKLLKDKEIITYDLKKSLIALDMDIDCHFDLMVASYLIEYPASDDISKLMKYFDEDISSFEEEVKSEFKNLKQDIARKSRLIYEYSDKISDKIGEAKQEKILNEIEMPLLYVLTDMEKTGFKFDSEPFLEMKKEMVRKIDLVSHEI